MKNNLLLLLILASSFSYSQEIKSIPGPRILVDGTISTPKTRGIRVLNDGIIPLPELRNSFREVPSLSKPLPKVPQAKYQQTLPNGNMVFALPQDNLPCIVPNENASVPMPNLSSLPILPYSYKGPGAIPNPAVPILIKPTKK